MKNIGLLLITVSLALASRAQEPAPATLKKDMDDYRSQRLQEKLFVHTDKSFYLAGEICWFKLYYVDAGSHHPLGLSKIAYLEWLDKDNKPILQAKVGLSKGHGDGSLYLPLTLRSGNYKLRAYTSWMKNFGADWFFEKDITVVNTRRSGENPIQPAPLKYSIVFFPEGGNLVENISSKIAFKVADQYGKGVECTGMVTEDDQDTLIRFRPEKFGIGNFMLTPRAGHHYRGTIRLSDGTAISTLLPAAYKEGVVMNVSPEGKDRVRVNILSVNAGPEVYLVAHTRQSVKLTEAAVLNDGKASFLVDKNKLGDGISHLTVFNMARQPVCERLIFKNPEHRLHMEVRSDKDRYSTRKKINLEVTATAEGGSTLTDCSLSVYRVDGLQAASSDHIADYLLLTSDLKGRVETPDYYFDHPEDLQAMDNLMISQGWRRFRWEEVLHHSNPTLDFPPEYNGAIISGRVINSMTGTSVAVKNVQGYLAIPGTRTQFTSAWCDDEGKIRFEMRDFYGSGEIIVQTNPEIDSMYRIDIANPFSETYTNNSLPPFQFSRVDSGLLADKNFDMQVLNRYAGIRLKQFQFPAFDTSTFFVKPDFTYLLDNYTRFTTMEEVMREYVIWILVKRKEGHYHVPMLDSRQNTFFDRDPLVLMDGVPVFNLDKLMVLDPLKIRKLETIHQKYFLGGTDYDGVMNWISYKGDLAGYVLDANATVVDYEGLQLQREFYSPSYETELAAADHLPDFRNVLYWSPELSVTAAGKSQLSFYSSDLPGKYMVVVEGLAADGTPGSCVTGFEVDGSR